MKKPESSNLEESWKMNSFGSEFCIRLSKLSLPEWMQALFVCVVFLCPQLSHAQITACAPGFYAAPDSTCRFALFSVPPPLGDAVLGDIPLPAVTGSLLIESKNAPTTFEIGLDEFVKDRSAAKALGKALFWDIQVGSDGQTACATCHHHAGADGRLTNATSPGADGSFGGKDNGDRAIVLPGSSLSAQSFPTARLSELLDRFNVFGSAGIAPFFSKTLRNVDDVVGSAGVRRVDYLGVNGGQAMDAGAEAADPVFFSGDGNLRQVTGRQAPTVFNAAFYSRQFWDGRANEIFNGADPFGPTQANARIWISEGGGVWPAKLNLRFSALASQAVGPPNNHIEMAFGQPLPDGSRGDARTFPELARKMLSLRPLADQDISPTDSVLGDLRHPSGGGLQIGYRELIQEAFHQRYWDEAAHTSDGIPLMEANFSLFWGLAVQVYEEELVSSPAHTRFDRFISQERYFFGNMESIASQFIEDSVSIELNEQEKLGMRIFFNDGVSDPTIGAGFCAGCHAGPSFSIATHFGKRTVEVEPIVDPFKPPAVHLKGPIESMLMQQAADLGTATFAERPALLPQAVLPMDCSIPTGDPDELCVQNTTWPMRDGPLGRKFEIRQNSSAKTIYWSFYPAISPPCGEVLILPLNPTPHTPLPLIGPDGEEIPILANMVYVDNFSPLSQACDNIVFEFELVGLPPGSYSLFVDGTEQTRIDGSSLFLIEPNAKYDLGFYNIGVRPTHEDLGAGARLPGSNELGLPLSFSRRLKEGLEVPELMGPGNAGDPASLVTPSERVVDAGTFKVPTLRNVEMTGPFFHTGGVSRLEDVVDFYNRGADFHETNIAEIAPEIARLGLTNFERQALVAFLKTLTDERVRLEQAPFDHPSLPLPDGDDIVSVGANGRPAECLPTLQSLDDRMSKQAGRVAMINDCNMNGVEDGCDIAAGVALDADSNGIPDECPQAPPCADGIDQDADGLVDLDDPGCNGDPTGTEGHGWCDTDFDHKVDIIDVQHILARKGQISRGPADRSDVSGDGQIDGTDALLCFVQCDNFGCRGRRSSRCGLLGAEALFVMLPLLRRRRARNGASPTD